jgi:hypothetical protein
MPEGHIKYFTPAIMMRLFAEVSLREADVLNRSWIVARRLEARLRASALRAMAKLARRLTPAIAPFPVGHR